MRSTFIRYDSEGVRVVAATWGQIHSINVEETLLGQLEQKFPTQAVSVLTAAAEDDILMLKLHSAQWKEDNEVGLTAEGSLLW